MSEASIARYAATLEGLREQGLFKAERIITSPQSAQIELADGRTVLNFCANNYLGLADHPNIIAAAKDALDSHGFGMASVRFICGTQDLHMEGFDVGLEMSGNPRAFNDMLDCMYHGGKIALLGILPKGAGVDWDRIIFKGLTVQGIYGRRMYETWYKMTQLVLSGFPLGKVLTHQLPIDDFQKGFDLMEQGKAGKVVLSWN